MKTAHLILTAALSSLLVPFALAQNEVPVHGVESDDADMTPMVHHPAGDKTAYSAYAQRDFPTHVYFGDTHHHTANSGDAFMAGDRLGPEEAYRFARGEEIISSTGIPAKLSRPLDFLCVSDHAEGLGIMFQVYQGNEIFMQDEVLASWNKAMKDGGKAAADAANDIVVRQGNGTLPAPVKDPKIAGPIMKVHRDRREIQRAGPLHRDDRL
jgi:hypothetical protein